MPALKLGPVSDEAIVTSRSSAAGCDATAKCLHSSIVLLALIAVHALAALYHHFVRHDGVLLRMLPARR